MKASGTKMRTLLRRALPSDATAPGLARRALGELPPPLGVDPADLRLMVSELVTNSVRHAQAAPSERIELDIFEMGAGIHVEVRDPGSGYASVAKALGVIRVLPRSEETSAEGGFGLLVVADLADRCGARWDGGTVTWFELDRDEGAARNES